MIGPRIEAHGTPIQFEGPSNLVNRTLVVLETEFLEEKASKIWHSPYKTRIDRADL